jgi:hypothetical protein
MSLFITLMYGLAMFAGLFLIGELIRAMRLYRRARKRTMR